LGVQKSKIARSKAEKRKGLSGLVFEIPYFKNDDLPYDAFMRRMFALQQSGIMDLWKVWQHRIDAWNDTVQLARNQEARPISTSCILCGCILCSSFTSTFFVGLFYI